MKKYLLSLLFLSISLTMPAFERPASKMRQAALRTLNATQAKITISKPTLDIYCDGKRFSIVSRDDRFPEVLAYGMGNFDADNLPANVRWWFDAVQHSMESAVKRNATRRASKTYEAVEPMLTSKWGQFSPFNDMCPRVSGDEQDTSSDRCPSGCVATAMAQVMNYQQYPASASFKGSCYLNGSSKVYETITIQTTYSWPYLFAYGAYLPTADAEVAVNSYNVMQGKRVATLLRDCGYAIGMSYDISGSGALTADAGNALALKFNYPKESVKYVSRDLYTDDDWMDMLQQEFANGCPVIYAGNSEGSGGHAFVLHGMDSNGLVCVNWGWQGQNDGYYAINLLSPGEDDFSEGQEAMIGIRPTALSTDVFRSVFATYAPYTFTYDNTTTELTLILNDGIYNLSCYDFTGRWCVVIEDMKNPENTGIIDLVEEGTLIEYFVGYSAQTIPLGEGEITPGTYRIYIATKDADEAAWSYVITKGGDFYYDMTVAADGKATIASTPTFTKIAPNLPTAIREVRKDVAKETSSSSSVVRYYDLQGREVDGSTKGLLIRRQGNEVKKVIVK